MGVKMPDSYISDLARGRYGTVNVTTAHKFAEYFQCRIEDLFPSEGKEGRQQDHQQQMTDSALADIANDPLTNK
jgi:hypothetical protein